MSIKIKIISKVGLHKTVGQLLPTSSRLSRKLKNQHKGVPTDTTDTTKALNDNQVSTNVSFQRMQLWILLILLIYGLWYDINKYMSTKASLSKS